jgi:release factor glutamine methyltransferase
MTSGDRDRDDSDQPWTLGRLLKWTTQYLKQHGSDTPQLDAQLLLAHARQCPRIELFTSYDEVAAESLRTEFRELVRKRAAGSPVAYLTGHREFYSLDFQVTPDVLIPRPETEFLVIAVLDLIKRLPPSDGTMHMADVGTGSGILACCLARQVASAEVWGTDVSGAALEVASRNCAAHAVSDRVHLRQGDLLDPIEPEIWLDFIVSNPPYVTTAEYAALPRDVREYEPRTALLAGERGTEIIERLIPQAASRLKPGGSLLLEISPMLEQAVRDLFAQDGRFSTPATTCDLAGHARVIQAAIPL